MLVLRRWYNRKAVAVEDPVRRTVVIGGSIRNAATTKDDDDDDDDEEAEREDDNEEIDAELGERYTTPSPIMNKNPVPKDRVRQDKNHRAIILYLVSYLLKIKSNIHGKKGVEQKKERLFSKVQKKYYVLLHVN